MATTVHAARPKALAKAIADLREKYGPFIVQPLSQVRPIERLSTGIAKLDEILGGGWPKGRISEAWGPQSAGKTTLCIASAVAVQQADPKAEVPYFDLENTLDAEWAAKCGVVLSRLLRIGAVPAEEVLDLVIQYVKAQVPLVILDSVVELIPEKELLKSATKPGKISHLAKTLSENLPKIVILQSQSPTVVLLTNQVRDKIGFMFGEGRKAPGGQALFHLDSIRLRVQRKARVMTEDQKHQVGIEVALQIVKSKVTGAQEGAEARIAILAAKGIVEDVVEAARATDEEAAE